MTVLKSECDLNAFLENVRKKNTRLLLLDYDGTLAPFQIERKLAVPYPGIRECLEKIQKTEKTRVIIISGRSVEDLLPLIGLKQPPEIWGTHGWERYFPNGAYECGSIPEQAEVGLSVSYEWLVAAGLANHIERKPASIAVHWRGMSSDIAEKLKQTVLEQWKMLIETTGLSILEFDGGIELRIPGRNKGWVIDTIISGLEEDTTIAYFGDDLTDEEAFLALAGKGLRVLVRKKLRSTSADIHLVPPDELLTFLEYWII